MISEFLRALFSAGVPVGISSFLLTWWALRNDYFGKVEDIKGFEKEVKRLTKSKSRKKSKNGKSSLDDDDPPRPALNPVHNKWLSFGGGFYGVVALLTYVVIELGEVRDFISNLGGLFNLLANISVDLIVGFIVDSFTNFIKALAWPYFWIMEINSHHIWIWFLAAYSGYWAGTRLALHRAGSDTH